MRCPRWVLVKALASPCGLQAGLILASCQTSFNTYVRAERSDGGVSHLPTHAGMPPRRTLPEGRQAREGIFAPPPPPGTLPDPAACQLCCNSSFGEGPVLRASGSKTHERNFSLFLRHSFLRLCSHSLGLLLV